MTRVDFVFYTLSFFCYLSINLSFKIYENRLSKMNDFHKRKEAYELQIKVNKEIENRTKIAEKIKMKKKAEMASTAELLSKLPDQDAITKMSEDK